MFDRVGWAEFEGCVAQHEVCWSRAGWRWEWNVGRVGDEIESEYDRDVHGIIQHDER